MKNEYSRLTILEGIDVLLDSGKVSYRPKDKAKGFYHLYTNDKNEFNKILNTMIAPLEGWSNDIGRNYLPINPKQIRSPRATTISQLSQFLYWPFFNSV